MHPTSSPPAREVASASLLWTMNADGSRDVEEEEEDKVASPQTLLRRILSCDSCDMTLGFEVGTLSHRIQISDGTSNIMTSQQYETEVWKPSS